MLRSSPVWGARRGKLVQNFPGLFQIAPDAPGSRLDLPIR